MEKSAYKIMRDRVAAYADTIADERIRKMYLTCFYSSLDTAAEVLDDGTTFMLTGDIPAMWLRDSSVQVMGYLPHARADEGVARLIRGLLKRQFAYIAMDPYANAFNKEPNNHGHKDDVTDFDSPYIWERKYEIDSLCYPLWLAQKYARTTNDYSVFDKEFAVAYGRILDTFVTEQHHDTQSSYVHSRPKYPQFPSLENGGKGKPVGYTGLTWNGYRPSDDVCTYGYLIPSNMFAVVVLEWILANAERTGTQHETARAAKLVSDIREGLSKYATVTHPVYGKVYAYEVDGLGGVNMMDDANVPSLLSLPYLGWCAADDPVYKNTRRFLLSEENPYYYRGTAGEGIGSPHTPEGYIWHIGVIMQLLTSTDATERKRCFEILLNTDAGCGVMHEGFDCNVPARFTREWFCWANTLFAMAVEHLHDKGEL